MSYRHMVFQKGYAYKIFMCNDPSTKIYTAKNMLPLHDRVLAFFDAVEEKHYQRVMDHLYISDAFLKSAYKHEKYY